MYPNYEEAGFIEIHVNGRTVRVEAPRHVLAHFRDQFPQRTESQKTRYKTVMNLIICAYLQGVQDVPNSLEKTTTHTVKRLRGKIHNLIERTAENKRFGYITPDTGGDDIWFRECDLDGVAFNELSRGDAVTFEIGLNGVGPCAKRIRLE